MSEVWPSEGTEIDHGGRPFYRHLGIEVVQAEGGNAKLRLAVRPELANSRGEVHGGAIATLLDAALSTAARSALSPGSATATVSLTVAYLQPGRGDLLAIGRVSRAGHVIVAATAQARDQDGNLVAEAIGTLRAHRRPVTA